MRAELPLIVGISLACAFARADAIYLEGGRVLEGTAVVDGDKVTVELEAGRMSFARSEVVRIEKSTSPQEEVDQREKKLGKDDLAGMLELASYCHDHDLLGRERALLERVLAREPDHAEARRRLGYVRDGEAWVLRSDQLRKERLAQRDSDLERKRMRLEVEEANLRRERAEAALKADREREAQVTQSNPANYAPTWYSPGFVGYWRNGPRGVPPQNWQQPGTPNAQGNTFINGFRSPQSYFDDAYRANHGRLPPR